MNLTDILKKANPYLSAASNVGSLFSGLVGSIGQIGAMFSPDYWKAATGSGLTTAQQQQNEWNAEQSALSFARERDFAREQLQTQMAYNTQMSNTSYQRQVKDMQLAGLNPMLALGAGGASVPAVTTNGASSSPAHGTVGSPLGLGDLLQLQMVPAQLEQMRAQSEKLRADAAKSREETRGASIVNDIREATKDAAIEAGNLEPKLKAIGFSKVQSEIDQLAANVRKIAEETKTESEKQAYFSASALLNRVNANNIAGLLPYHQKLMEAQTEQAKKAAVLSAVSAMYQKNLIDYGYVKDLAREMAANAGLAENSEAVSDIATAIRTGDYSITQSKGYLKGGLGSRLLQGLTIALDNLNPLNRLISK